MYFAFTRQNNKSLQMNIVQRMCSIWIEFNLKISSDVSYMPLDGQ